MVCLFVCFFGFILVTFAISAISFWNQEHSIEVLNEISRM